MIAADGVPIGEHERRFSRYQTVYNPWHYVPALEHKPGALRNGAPFKDWNLPGAMTRVREKLAKHPDGDRQFVEILTMVALYGLEAVANACATALEQDVVASSHVVNLLHRAAQAPPVLVERALHERRVNVRRVFDGNLDGVKAPLLEGLEELGALVGER